MYVRVGNDTRFFGSNKMLEQKQHLPRKYTTGGDNLMITF